MKTLVIVRHSKSDWSDPNITDIERPLNKRGKRDAPFMAKLMKEQNLVPDLILTSPAERALQTVKYFVEEFKIDKSKIIVREEIYTHGSVIVRKLISQIDDIHNTVYLFGHNPDLTSLANQLLDVFIENIPTTGIVCIDFDFKSWKEILNSKGKLRFFEYPKKYFKKK
ncbi:MAG: histidine phosphatase family protein [Ignavibacteria bacterium]|nr:histidine phosphatase family protein [Ignavibacteria bacterium]